MNDRNQVLTLLVETLLWVHTRPRKRYIQEAHERFIETRFRTFEEHLMSTNRESLHGYLRLYPEEFEILHARLNARLEHIPTHRAPISSRKRLCLFLRFVAHGTSFSHLSGEFGVGISTVCQVIYEVARAIIEELHDAAFPTPTPLTWSKSVEVFRSHWDCPAALGALDGKHVSCVCPSKSGSSFYNYKGFYSIVLLALVDGNYKCILYDLGASGRSSDSGVFLDSPMKSFIEQHEADFPEAVQLSVGKVPCHFLVDQGFRMTPRFIRPYSSREATANRRSAHFNTNLSRARGVVENYFGILASRFRLLLRPIYATSEHAKAITLSIMILHNLMVGDIGAPAVFERYGISNFFENEDGPGIVGNIANDAKSTRDLMRTFFCRRDGVR